MRPEVHCRNRISTRRFRLAPGVWRLMLGFWLICAGVAHADTEQVTGVIHIDALETGAQDLSIAEAVDLVARAGLGIAILTPHDNAVVKYGLLPFRNLLKMQVTQASIQEFGVQRYVDAVRATDEGIPEVITISGTEAIPAYYWEDVWGGQPVVRNLHKHLLVIGLSEPEDYADIPSMTNGFPFNPWCLLYLWPIAVILSGGFLMFQARRTTTADNTRSLKPGALLTIIGGLFFLNSVPFWPVYDQYHGDPGNGPYQAVVDYANARNAMTFWAHPEVTQRMSQPAPWQASILADSVVFETLPYTNALLETFGYTGFAIFEEGMLVVGKPGGIWDQTLIEYCAGVRSNPVWAIAEVDFEYSHIREGVGTSQTVFYLDKRNTAGVLDAMRHGAMYARRGAGCGLSVRDFRVSDPDGQAVATMGGHVTLTESPRIRIELDVENANIGDLQILVVRGGDRIRTIPATDDTVITFDDPVLGGEGTTFYRFIVLENMWPILATNPIFVTIKPSRNALQGNGDMKSEGRSMPGRRPSGQTRETDV